jgi:hypothetical protein
MLYQLPNGKTIWLSIEQFLQLTDDDIRQLIAANAGAVITSPFLGSTLDTADLEKDEEEQELDESVELLSDEDDISISRKDILNIPEEGSDFTDLF